MGEWKRHTWSQFPPEPKIEEDMATMWSLFLLTFPHAPRPTSKKVPWMAQRVKSLETEREGIQYVHVRSVLHASPACPETRRQEQLG